MANDDPQTKARQARWRRRSVWAAGIAFALAVLLLGVPEVLPERWVGSCVAGGLSALLDEEVTVRKARVRLWGDFSLSDVTLGSPPGSWEYVSVQAVQIDGRFSVWALLRGRIHVLEATAGSLAAIVAWHDDGQVGLAKLLRSRGARRIGFQHLEARDISVIVLPRVQTEETRIVIHSAELDTETDGSYRLEARVSRVSVDQLLATLGLDAGAAPAKSRLPRLTAQVRGSFRAWVGRVTCGEQSFSEARLAGTVADGVVELAELSARTGDGSLSAAGRLALGGEGGHALTVRTDRLLLNRDFFEMLRATPYHEVANAVLPFYDLLCVVTGGPPQRLQLEATMAGEFRAEGQDVEAVLASLEGEAEATLTEVWFVGSPLLRQIGALLQAPELREMQHFERVDLPFTLGDGRVALTAVVPYQQGALVLEGTTGLAEPMAYDYRLTVREPKGIQGIPGPLAAYLAGGRPAALVRGHRAAPVLTIPWQAIRAFILQQPRRPSANQGHDDEQTPPGSGTR